MGYGRNYGDGGFWFLQPVDNGYGDPGLEYNFNGSTDIWGTFSEKLSASHPGTVGGSSVSGPVGTRCFHASFAEAKHAYKVHRKAAGRAAARLNRLRRMHTASAAALSEARSQLRHHTFKFRCARNEMVRLSSGSPREAAYGYNLAGRTSGGGKLYPYYGSDKCHEINALKSKLATLERQRAQLEMDQAASAGRMWDMAARTRRQRALVAVNEAIRRQRSLIAALEQTCGKKDYGPQGHGLSFFPSSTVPGSNRWFLKQAQVEPEPEIFLRDDVISAFAPSVSPSVPEPGQNPTPSGWSSATPSISQNETLSPGSSEIVADDVVVAGTDCPDGQMYIPNLGCRVVSHGPLDVNISQDPLDDLDLIQEDADAIVEEAEAEIDELERVEPVSGPMAWYEENKTAVMIGAGAVGTFLLMRMMRK